MLAGLGLAVLLAPWISPHEPNRQHSGQELLPPRPGFWLGTDEFGRDILSRSLFGARLSLATGLAAAVVAGLLGTGLGGVAGLWGGRIDGILSRLFDTILAFPGLLLALAAAVLLGKGVYNAGLAATLMSLPLIARLARASVLAERQKEYVLAAHAVGAAGTRIGLLHLLPNILPVIFVQVTLTVADAMLVEAGLSFLGLGAQPPRSSLGLMLRDSREFLNDAVWYAAFPGAFLTAFLLAISFISDALADVFDPRRQLVGVRA